MSNHQAIKDNVRSGDILLSRRIYAPALIKIDGVFRSNWEHVYLYLGEDKVMDSDWSNVHISPLDHYLNSECEVGLFRTTPGLTEEEMINLTKVVRIIFHIEPSWLQRVWWCVLSLFGKEGKPNLLSDVKQGMMCPEAIATVYQKIDRQLKSVPPWHMKPVDFDESPITVRIA